MCDKAISELLEVIRLRPDLPEAHASLALAYGYKSMIREAVVETERSLALLSSTEKGSRHLLNAINYALSHRPGDALRIFDEYKERRSKSKRARTSRDF